MLIETELFFTESQSTLFKLIFNVVQAKFLKEKHYFKNGKIRAI